MKHTTLLRCMALIFIGISGFTMQYAAAGEDRLNMSKEKKLALALIQIQEKYMLTNREREMVEQIYSGKTNNEIAKTLFISESTVKAHIYNIFKKLEVKNRMEVIRVVRDNI